MDPFSALSVAAASLQLVDQLVKVTLGTQKLYEKLAAAPQQIRRKREHVEQLRDLSASIQSLFQGPHEKHDPRNQPLPSNLGHGLHSLLSKAEDELIELENILKPLDVANGDDKAVKRFWGRVKSVKQEGIIHGCLDRLKELYIQLQISLDLYHSELFSIATAQSGVALENISTLQTSMSGTITELHRKVDEQACAGAHTAELNLKSHRATHSRLDTIDASSSALQMTLSHGFSLLAGKFEQEQRKVTQELRVTRNSVELLLAGRIASKPACVAGILDDMQRQPFRQCPCQRLGVYRPLSFGSFTWNRRVYGVHYPGCSSYAAGSEDTLPRRYSLTIGRVASLSIELMFNSVRGAGAFSLPEQINFISIVADDDDCTRIPGYDRIYAAFDSIHRIHGRDTNVFDIMGLYVWDDDYSLVEKTRVKQILNQLLIDLQTDFGSGRVSGRVQTTTGRTLLHMFGGILGLLWSIQEDTLGSIKTIIELLHRHGTPINALCKHSSFSSEGTALSMFFPWLGMDENWEPGSTTFLRLLCDLGVTAAPVASEEDFLRHIVPDSTQVRLFTRIPDLAIEAGYSRLALAVVHRNIDEVQFILSQRGRYESGGSRGVTPLQLSIGWPTGMKLLLQKGANPSETVHCTVDLQDDTSLEILLDADSRLFLGVNGREKSLLEHALYRNYSLHVANGLGTNERILPLIVEALTTSRRCLMRLARSYLSDSRLRDLGWAEPQRDYPLLDSSTALDMIRQLQMRGVKIPDRIWPDSRHRSVYHTEYMIVEVADSLFQAGFDEIDIKAPDGWTPLLVNIYDYMNGVEPLKVLGWFLDHDARNLVFPELNAISLYHALAAKVATRYSNVDDEIRVWLTKILRKAACVVPRPPRDLCSCYCSDGGCSAITSLLRHQSKYMEQPRDHTGAGFLYTLWETRKRIFRLWLNVSHAFPDKQPFTDFCRFELFERLGMKHTCCQLDWWIDKSNWPLLLDRCEAAEFQQEDQYLDRTLNRVLGLYNELHAQYQNHFEVFWDAWWKVIQADVPVTFWERVQDVDNDWSRPRRVDTDIPILDEDSLETTLQRIREDVSSWVDDQIRLEDEIIEEGMAWWTSLVES
ncbi:uncharacterized protein HMPREF1541_07448 [Cyphellophora europaea CBS 101466]|uniref:Fungal N-terminal domain-containing protein n=1 Tax=Cyphellophora europaea (strain CBS 101466) TaxID=1220924 RepID=W2RNB5_CYPE1|nr:uncharacterized protein HMPREF1541_07448 [Cyphellophora europaea CBS 101466]ETN37825.1 hypothetical protein HMPREF1541_07448 [Cyphellophora europaea CBS 101466]